MHPYDDPIARFREDLAKATRSETFDATRCALATADADGRPSVRFVLLKYADERGFGVFTNYESRKARELDANPRAALAFHWASLGEQVRIEGAIVRMPAEVSDEYFASRPRGSRIGAWASPQSRAVESRAVLDARVAEVEARFEGSEVPRPAFWGGYFLVPDAIEFWFDGVSRLHDRYLYRRGGVGEGWTLSRLAP